MKRLVCTITIILLLILNTALPASSFAEQSNIPSTFQHAKKKLHFNRLNSDNGLSNNFLTAVAQDKLGFMWFGSRYGLNKFDGMNGTVYTSKPNDPNSLSNNYAWYLFVDRAGTIWVATWGGGLNRYDEMSDSFTRYMHDENDPSSIGSDLVWYVYEDRGGTIWVATDGGGLNRLDSKTGKFKRYEPDPKDPGSISHMTVTQIVEDSSGALWMGTYGGGLNKFDPVTETFKRYQHDAAAPKSLSNNNIWSVYIDSKQRLWVGTEGGLNLYNPKTETFVHYVNRKDDHKNISHNTVLTIHEDRSGVLWIGTFGGGLNRFDPESDIFSHYMHRPFDDTSLCDNTVYHIFEDRSGSMWVATENGINRVDSGDKRFIHYKRIGGDPESLSSNKVRAIYEDDDGTIWVGTEGGGLNRFDRRLNNFKHYQYQAGTPNSLSSNAITSIAAAPENTLWVGTEGGGLNRFDPQTGKSIHYRYTPDNRNSISNDTIWDLSVDRQGNLWIVMDGGGLDRFDPEKKEFKHWKSNPNDQNSLVSDWALSVFTDSRGMIWVGTDSGLSRFDPERNTFKNYFSRQFTTGQSENNSIFSIFEDKHGAIWVGTNDGLRRLNKKGEDITAYRERDGLAGNYVADIQEDHMGFLWISTNKGLSRFDPKTDTFRNYDKWDGLQGNYFLWGSGLKSRSNELYFGGINGLTRFNPAKLSDNRFVPPVVLTDFKLFNKSVVPGTQGLPQHISTLDHITLSHSQSVFTLEFAALNFRSPQKNRYAYKLEGFDSDWNYVGSERRYATYTNLDPRTYFFHVKASNNDGIWNEKGTSLEITIRPPWWETVWFKLFLLVLCLFSIFGVIKYIHRLRFEIKERQKATDALQESEGKYSLAMDTSTDGLWDWNLSKNSIYYSPGWKRMLGYDNNELPNDFSIWENLTAPDDIKRSRKLQQEVIDKKTDRFEIEVKMKHKNGHWVNILSRARVLFDDGGKPIRMIGTHVDITNQKKIEERLQQTQKMESIGNLAGGIAHDFNNLLFPIVGLSEMMLDDFPSGSMAHQNLHEIFQAGKRGRELVQQILSFSRQSEHQPIPVHIQKILMEVLKLCRATIPADIPITQDIMTDCGPVMAEPTQIHQIAMNLITNAFHAVEPTRGSISIQLTEMDLDQTDDPVKDLKPGRYAMLSVSDAGMGIDPAVINKIFDPYFTTKEKGKGTGLGLATVYGIVKAHGGDIRVYSDIGKGATFHVYLPLLEKAQESEPEKEITPLPTGTEHILLVDDEKAIVHLEKQMLERLGYHISCFTGSKEALAAFKTDPSRFDLVVTDMNMPHINGMQLATELIAIRPDIPIIICTGFSERFNEKDAKAMGIKCFLMKPVVMADMAKEVRRVLDKD